jgi:hypothetical protein
MITYFARLPAALFTAALASCAPDSLGGDAIGSADASALETTVHREFARMDSAAARVDRIFQPLPLLSFAEEAALRRYSNAQHVARARALGIPRGLTAERIRALEEQGRLVRLDSSDFWIARSRNGGQLAVPAVRSTLDEIGRRFQARLAALGAPAYRIEVTSVLRTAADQAALRRVNPNAAAGESAHEFGTTFDVLYSAYSAPVEPFVQIDAVATGTFQPALRRYADVAAERVAGRRALELKAILGKVLLEMQREGRILVTIEQLQPVYHITVARAS